VRAQGLSGKVTVGFDGSNAAIAAVVEAAAAAVQAANPGAEIEISPAPAGNYETQLFLALSSGQAPDVFVTSGLGIGELGPTGAIEPLDAYLSQWDGWPQYPEAVRQAISYNGSTWALPTSIDTHFLYYRKDLFESAGLARDWQPNTPDDILAAARQVKAALPDVIPYGLYAGANGGNATAVRGFLPLLHAYGGTLKDESGRWVIDSPALRSTLGYYQTVFQVDETVPQQAMTAANPARMLRTSFATGELATLYDGSWVYADWEAAAPEIAHEQTGYVLFPTADGRPSFAIGGLGASWYINARASAKDLAWALLAAGNSPEALVALNTVSPHIPPRLDAAASPAFQASPFLTAMVDSMAVLQLQPPDPAYRHLIGIIQNATGIVATGEAAPDEAIQRYAEEMTRILGEDSVTAQS
jgi:multiple sugar transport system substrate-binding protein